MLKCCIIFIGLFSFAPFFCFAADITPKSFNNKIEVDFDKSPYPVLVGDGVNDADALAIVKNSLQNPGFVIIHVEVETALKNIGLDSQVFIITKENQPKLEFLRNIHSGSQGQDNCLTVRVFTKITFHGNSTRPASTEHHIETQSTTPAIMAILTCFHAILLSAVFSPV